jgi:hypothetical protein
MVDLLPAREMRLYATLAAMLVLAPTCRAQPAGAAPSPRKFWNLTATTITQLSVAPAGRQIYALPIRIIRLIPTSA